MSYCHQSPGVRFLRTLRGGLQAKMKREAALKRGDAPVGIKMSKKEFAAAVKAAILEAEEAES